MGRSVFSIVAGFLLIALLSLGGDLVLRRVWPAAFDATGGTDSLPALLITLAYSGVFAVVGSYVTARLAPNRPMRHALMLGTLGLVLGVLATMGTWDTAPAWYHVATLALVLPYAWLGGRLRELELDRRYARVATTA